jgi:formamidopyrimidine-DNA glycosylase
VPELPDVTLYIEALQRRLVGARLERVQLNSPFVLRSVDPPLTALVGRSVRGLRRLGKRIALEFDGGLFLVVHLMIAGRLRWQAAHRPIGRGPLAGFAFDTGTLLLTEAGSRKRAALHVVAGESALAEHDPGGLEVLGSGPSEFARVLRSASHTLKRALTDPRLFSGIGNAYSDEILHRAGLSPLLLTSRIDDEQVARLHAAAIEVLGEWIERLRQETGEGFPEKVTALRPGMAVHGRAGQPCPRCGAPVQRIVYAENETDYCARCQTGGRLLADRALSRLLKRDWPRTLEELEALRRPRGGAGEAKG